MFCGWFSSSLCFSSVWFLFPLFMFFPSPFCFVLVWFFFYRSWGISVALRSLGGMSGMFWFNTSLPEPSFDKSINICGFWGQSTGGYREMKQPGCKPGMRMGKLNSTAGIRKGVIASGARGWQMKLWDFSNSEAKHMTEKTSYIFQAGIHVALRCPVLPALLWTSNLRSELQFGRAGRVAFGLT